VASNKNQHFVPKVYLKQFSPEPSKSSTNLFNIQRGLHVQGASIRGQCAASYFYGQEPRLETMLQEAESQYGLFLIRLENPDFSASEADKAFLRRFCFLQHCRTAAHAERAKAFLEATAYAGFEGNPPPEWIPSARETAIEGLSGFAQSASLVDDLKVRLIRNSTKLDFITSDNPSVYTNRWHFQSPKAKDQSPGIANAGAIFFMPITPRTLCVMYDGDVYTAQHRHGWIDVDQTREVEALNQHQFLGCQANIFFRDWSQRNAVTAAYSAVSDRRLAQRHEVRVAALESEDATSRTYRELKPDEIKPGLAAFIHTREIYPRPLRWSNVVRMRHTPKVYTNGSGTGFMRAWTSKSPTSTGRATRDCELDVSASAFWDFIQNRRNVSIRRGAFHAPHKTIQLALFPARTPEILARAFVDKHNIGVHR
jgi:hypothetical protein